MSLIKTWYTPEEAAEKFGLGKETVLEWVAEGLVRCEKDDGNVDRLNIDDVALQVEELIRHPDD